MKHTFVFIDKVLIILKDVPKSLDTPEKKEHAHKIVRDLESYTRTLKKIIHSHKQEEYRQRLHNIHLAGAPELAGKVDALIKKFDSLLVILERDAEVLKDTIENSPEKWVSRIGDLAFDMVMTGLHQMQAEMTEEDKEIERFKQMALFEMHELEELVDSAEHISDILQ
ncbi:TPA: hypothetical protein HA265_00555 [Candidatus Woesearchaeota archaeon]|nr:hypothetical protein [Candidatus Woesearchaeota archaeon]